MNTTNANRTLIVTDHDNGRVREYPNADAAAYAAAFDDFATPLDFSKLAEVLDTGCVYESWSGKSTDAIERDREPLRYWTALCALIETDNQIWEVQ